MINLNKGTKEYIRVEVGDTLENLTTLSGTSPTYDVYANDDADTQIVTAGNPVISTLNADCLIDDSGDDYPAGEYKLYLSFDATPERPRIGPIYFRMNSV